MATAVAPKPPVGELGVVATGVPTWDALGRAAVGALVTKEHVPQLQWPTSVRLTYPLMRNDTQLSGLYRGTTLPVRRYVWGIDENGADPAVVDAVCRDFNVQPVDDAWQAYLTGQSNPIPRERNEFAWDQHLADLLRALYLGHYYFELVGDVATISQGGDGLWHPAKLGPIAPDTISQFFKDGNAFAGVKQLFGMDPPLLPAGRLAGYVFDQEGGDPVGRSMFRSCYREWLLKDELLRVDLVNHQRAGGIFIGQGAQGATRAEIEALSELAQNVRVSQTGGGAVPAGSDLKFYRATGGEVIGSINRHDESMAREFLMMFMALGTSSSGGNRALASSFIDWFAISQEAIAIWARDRFNKQVLERYVAWNFGELEYVPLLAFKRPESANPLDAIANAVATPATAPGALVAETPNGTAAPVAAVRYGPGGAYLPGFGPVVMDGDTRDAILAEHAEYERFAGRAKPPLRKPARAAVAGADTVPLPDRLLRRGPNEQEVRAAVDFKVLDENWQAAADRLVASWQSIRAGQIAELEQQISAAGGDLAALAQIRAAAAGGDLIASQLHAMAHTGAAEAAAEATRQGVTATMPDLATLETELAARAAALEQLLASALSQAAGNKAVQLSGGTLTSAEVATQVADYLNSLTDAYLTDQFGGALSAAQNGGRLAAMDHNGASSYYASELLDVNTCDPCAENDGKEYASADEAAADYPAGGYFDCDGGPRCRGTCVAVYDEAQATVA